MEQTLAEARGDPTGAVDNLAVDVQREVPMV